MLSDIGYSQERKVPRFINEIIMKLMYFFKCTVNESLWTDGGRGGRAEEHFAFLPEQKSQVKQKISWKWTY